MFGLCKQSVAPIENGSQCPMPRQGGAPPTRQQPKAVIEAGRQAANAEDIDACGGQLNGKRYTIEPTADLDDNRRVDAAQLETVGACCSALDE